MQITLFYFKNDEMYYHCIDTSKNLDNHINLTIKIEKQEIIIWITV